MALAHAKGVALFKGDIDSRRRSLLLGSASLASLAGTGCCTVPRPEIPGLCHTGTSTYLSGIETQAVWASPSATSMLMRISSMQPTSRSAGS